MGKAAQQEVAAAAEAAGEIPFHPFANLFPMIKGPAADEFAADIKANGIIEPIILYQGQVLDGRNRYRAARTAGLEVADIFEQHTRTFEGTEQEAFDLVISLNLRRRHLNNSQRAMVAASMANITFGQTLKQGPGRSTNSVSDEEAGAAMNVSDFLVKQAKTLKKLAAPHIVTMVETGQVAVHAAHTVATNYSMRRQNGMTTPEAVQKAAAAIRDARRRFQRFSPTRVLNTIVEIAEETTARDGLADFIEAADAGTAKAIDGAIERLSRLRDAIAAAKKP